MKKLTTWMLALLVSVVTLSTMVSCSKDDEDDDLGTVPVPGTLTEVSGNITANTTWSAKNQYLLKSFVYVQPGVTLTIEPGTVIKGDQASKATLFILPGAKIIADGTKEKPIVFTSNQAIGSRRAGDWGGVVILGKAPANKKDFKIEGEEVSIVPGGATGDAADNSGILRYVRIEFGGIAFQTDKEINGLTLAGVGSGTVIDYVQVSYSGDDAIEWFGGTVNAKHLVAYRTLDDDFDTDYGYSGIVQYGLILRDPAVADQCTCSDSNGFESDNDGTGSADLPQTSAKFGNISVFMGTGTVNSKFRSAFRIRRNSAISIYNSTVVGAFPKGGLELESDASQNNFKTGKSDYRGLAIVNNKAVVSGDTVMLKAADRKNMLGAKEADLKLPANFNVLTGKPGILLQTGSPLLTGGATLPTGLEATTYMGAFGTTDWTETWTNFDPQNTDYTLK
ncbi:T9SS C-terminal target domain-containing protein [Larkinella humicola]|uniref:T9SS C-terminal target domain-containing protein n=1 Tax=Larkinella humicola TaxID=2607654 RepID=A0A5N1JHU2_9BACT|nr:T9SS C-terminal target domain-containing protein [Larkinella humicola]KAA9352792.1 T9SS C-terminal target domain-containing protein [Larkinella humicola]